MKLSVIIPFHSELSLIGHTVNSVLINSNFFNEVEIILINDGLYNEGEIRSCFSKNLNKLIIIKQNVYTKGPGGARNTGLDISRGDIIAFLDADDFWLQGKLDAQMREIKKGATFVVTSYRFDNSKTTINPPRSIDRPEDIFLRRGIGTSTVIITKELLENHKFRNIRFGQDIDFWFALANSKKFKYAGVSEVLVEYNTGGSTKNKWVQLFYVNKILSLNKINIFTRIKVNVSYILTGVYNHYIKKKFLSSHK
jgi:glycosyltransferase involved in cell wall biosynthesis